MQKKVHPATVLGHKIKRIFRSRNIIIISDRKVDHVPLSSVIQLLVLLGFFGFFSGVSYITGSYMAAKSIIKEKDKRIVNTAIEKERINGEVDMLKRDLIRLDQSGADLNYYSKMIINQDKSALSHMPKAATEGDLFGQNTGKLLDRISFLENRLNDIKSENANLVTAIRERTDKKINYLEDVISMTGLDAGNLEHSEKSEGKGSGKNASYSSKTKTIYHDNEDASKEPVSTQEDNQGGPFIPYDSVMFNSTEQSLLADVDRLVMLHNIIKKLPLSQPMNDAQLMSPFGRRVDPINHRWSMHPGLDMAGATGAQVLAANEGVIVAAGRKPAYGNMVDIEHRFGIITRYAHMSKILVHEGETVGKGQIIGIQGSTGRSTGPHLHYEVRINDHPVNPVNFLHAGEYVLEN